MLAHTGSTIVREDVGVFVGLVVGVAFHKYNSTAAAGTVIVFELRQTPWDDPQMC